MIEFLHGLAWGSGLSLGICVGLVAWIFLRTGIYWLLGVTNELASLTKFNADSLAALHERNNLTQEQIVALRTIAENLKPGTLSHD